eukprot:CAMPEP_0179136388 /NCGR_PEP_ID=MMETSP0796-20121207/64990_1 /TAXON_ID=73915 /ORGANISM="Pyrodinium bahamense, Strain pbaha01" /LENGTH=49 /DNA_ID= /DNA_START= /DNA_END= /DNA_ORIENTATION=
MDLRFADGNGHAARPQLLGANEGAFIIAPPHSSICPLRYCWAAGEVESA